MCPHGSSTTFLRFSVQIMHISASSVVSVAGWASPSSVSIEKGTVSAVGANALCSLGEPGGLGELGGLGKLGGIDKLAELAKLGGLCEM
jgi:hypothetical protein